MSSLEHGRFCQEVVNQTGLLVATLEGAELSATVPTAPDWALSDLVRHVGGNLRSVEQAVRTGEPVTDPEGQVPDHGGPSGGDLAPLFAWLTEAAGRFASTLSAAGPGVEAQVWTVRWPTAAWARRAAHDLLVHRADAAGTVGAAFTTAPDLAADALDEFLDLMSNPQVAAAAAETAGPGPAGPAGSIHLHATDTGPEVPSEWLIELGSPTLTWRHAHEKATAAVRGPVTDVLRVAYRRLPPDADGIEVLGDREVLDGWLERMRLQ
jgi:uncharacterized protein (TIGR03083 family)